MYRLAVVFGAALIAGTAGVAYAEEASSDLRRTGGIVYSANERGNSISAIDLAAGTVETVPIEISPHNVDLTPDGSILLAVGNPTGGGGHGSDGHGHADEGEEDGRLLMLDPTRLGGPAISVELGEHPAHVVADRAGRAFVTLAGANEVAVVDIESAAVVKRIRTGAYPHGLRLSPDERELYVANVEDGSVSVIGTESLTEAARIPVGSSPVQVGFTPAGDRVYVSLRDENRVAVIDVASRQVTKMINVGPSPIQVHATPDGRYVFVANQGTETEPNDTVSVIETATRQVVETIRTGRGAHGVSVSSDGSFVFVTNIADDTVSAIEVETLDAIEAFPVGDGPNGVAYGKAE